MDTNRLTPLTQGGADYHWKTAYDRHRMSGHYMDWANQPIPFKQYRQMAVETFEPVASFPEKSLWSLVSQPGATSEPTMLGKDGLARVLYLAGGITARSRQGGQDFYFRAQASAGALYPTEIYTGVFKNDGLKPDLKPGIYHFGADHFGLTPLRQGGIIHYPTDLGLTTDPERLPAISLYLSGIFFKSAWKYRARAFRYVLLDTGHVLENLVLALALENVPFTCHYDFNDEALGELIGLDENREAGLVCVNAGASLSLASITSSKPESLPSEIISAGQVSNAEVTYDEILGAYRGGFRGTSSPKDQPLVTNDIGVASTSWQPIESTDEDRDEHPFAWSVMNRRSKRNYVKEPLAKETFLSLLNLLCRSHGQDGPENRFACLRLGFLTENIQGVDPGFYLLDPENRRFGQVLAGRFIEPMTSVCLDQKWLSHATVHFLLMANLKAIDGHYGPRGYRYAMLNAGRLGQLIYLGATALGLGCCGIGALYDGDAQKLLGLNQDSALLYLLAAGPVKRL